MAKRADLLTVYDVAKALNVHFTTVYRMVNDGKLRGHRLGARTLRFSQSEVDRLLAESLTEPQPAEVA